MDGTPRPGRYSAAALLIGAAVYAADAASKAVAVADLPGGRQVTILGGLLTLHLVRNPGAAFGIGHSYTVIYALIAVGVLAVTVRVSASLRSWPWAIGLGLLLGGAAGNLSDRIFRSPGLLRGYVIDWIKLPYFPPTFNLADASLTIGVALIMLASICGWRLDGSSRPRDVIQRPEPPADVPPTVSP